MVHVSEIEVSKVVWSNGLQVDGRVPTTENILNFLETTSSSLIKEVRSKNEVGNFGSYEVGTVEPSNKMVETLLNWVYLLVEFSQPSQLYLTINSFQSQSLLEKGIPLKKFAHPIKGLNYQGALTVGAQFELNLMLNTPIPQTEAQGRVATDAVSRLKLALGEAGTLQLTWQGREVSSETRRAIGLATRQLDSFIAEVQLENTHQVTKEAEVLLDQAAHDLHGPFGSMMIAADLLLAKGLDLPATELRFLLQKFKLNTQTLQNMLDYYLETFRLGLNGLARPPKLEILDLSGQLQNIVELARPQIERNGQTIQLNLTSALPVIPKIWADKDYFSQILLNLIFNAQKHTPPGTQIWLKVAMVAPYLQITVIDNGPGLSSDLISSLETLFGYGPASVDGLGLGLKLVRDLTARQNGEVGFSTGKTGTNFWIKLPLAEF